MIHGRNSIRQNCKNVFFFNLHHAFCELTVSASSISVHQPTHLQSSADSASLFHSIPSFVHLSRYPFPSPRSHLANFSNPVESSASALKCYESTQQPTASKAIKQAFRRTTSLKMHNEKKTKLGEEKNICA